MGFLDYLGFGKTRRDFIKSGGLGIASPWTDGSTSLKSVVWSDILGEEAAAALPMDRAAAITIPAVSKGRNLLLGYIGKFPLVALGDDGSAVDQPEFLYRSETAVTTYERMTWTVDDLIFYGYALWYVDRDTDGKIVSAEYVPMDTWTLTNGTILIDEKSVPERNLIFFNSPFEGLLTVGNRALKGARDIEIAWTGRVKNPIPVMVLHSTTDDELEDDEITELVAEWAKGRRNPDGAIGWLPSNIDLEVHGEVSAELFIEGRNASRTDIGSFLNIPVAMLDGTIGVDSLTYSTTAGNRNRFFDESIPFWTDPIEARLSMDDVVPRGQRVRFDKTEAYATLPNPTDAPEKD